MLKPPEEIVTGPAAVAPSSISNVPDIEIEPLSLVAATSKSASDVQSSVPPATVPVPHAP